MQPADEARSIVELGHELVHAFPALPADKVRTAVEQAWMDFLHAPVREFVPLLVRRQVVAELRRLA